MENTIGLKTNTKKKTFDLINVQEINDKKKRERKGGERICIESSHQHKRTVNEK